MKPKLVRIVLFTALIITAGLNLSCNKDKQQTNTPKTETPSAELAKTELLGNNIANEFQKALQGPITGKYNQNRIDEISQDIDNSEALLNFDSQTPQKKKELILNLVAKNEYGIFYSLHATVKEGDKGYFSEALLKKGDYKSLIGLGEYVFSTLKTFREFHLKEMKLSEEKTDVLMAKYGSSIIERLEGLDDEIKILARRHSKELIIAFKKFVDDKSEFSEGQILGVMMPLAWLKTEGFNMIFSSIDETYPESVVVPLVEVFKSNALLPSLMIFENPNTPKYKKELVYSVIANLSYDNAEVFDTAIWALLHGPLNKKPLPKDVEGVLNEDVSWNVILITLLKKVNGAVDYIGKNIWTKIEDKQRGKLVAIMCRLDMDSSIVYFEKLDCTKLDDETRLYLFHHLTAMFADDKDEILNRKCDLFLKVFINSTPEQRRLETANFPYYPAEKMAKFYIGNFGKLTKEEQDFVISYCSSPNKKGEIFAKELRDEVYAKILPQCSDEQKNMIRIYKKLK